MKKWLKTPLCILIILGVSFIFYCYYVFPKSMEMRDRRLVRDANVLMEKIDAFRAEHGRAPDETDLYEMGVGRMGMTGWYYKAKYSKDDSESDAIYYEKKGCMSYMADYSKEDCQDYCLYFTSAMDGFESNSYCCSEGRWHIWGGWEGKINEEQNRINSRK